MFSVCTHAHTENLHTHTLSAMPFTLNTAVFLCEVRACPSLHHCWTYPEGQEVGHISVIIEKRFNMGVWSLYCSLRSEVKGGRVKKGLTPKNSCQPVGCRCRSAPMGLTKWAGNWQREGQGYCPHKENLVSPSPLGLHLFVPQSELNHWSQLKLNK